MAIAIKTKTFAFIALAPLFYKVSPHGLLWPVTVPASCNRRKAKVKGFQGFCLPSFGLPSRILPGLGLSYKRPMIATIGAPLVETEGDLQRPPQRSLTLLVPLVHETIEELF